jgi:hypothetical protein
MPPDFSFTPWPSADTNGLPVPFALAIESALITAIHPA